MVEIVEIKKAKKQPKGKRANKVVVKVKARRRGRKVAKVTGPAKLAKYYMDRLTYPGELDMSPLPMPGGTQPVVPLRSRAAQTYTETATANASIFYVQNIVSSATALYVSDTAASASTAFGSGTSNDPTQFVLDDSHIGNARITGMCIKVRYTGPPLSAQGMILVGARPSDSGSSSTAQFGGMSFNQIRLLPGVQCFTVAEGIREKCVAGVPNSNDWYVPIAIFGVASYWSLPFVAFTGLPVGGTIDIEITKCLEALLGNQSSFAPFALNPPVGQRYRSALESALEMLGTSSSVIVDSAVQTLRESVRSYAPALLSQMVGWGMSSFNVNRGHRPLIEEIA